MGVPLTQAWTIPGSTEKLLFERAESGKLLRLSGNGRTYVEDRDDGRHIGDDLATIVEVAMPDGLLRFVRAAGQVWSEEYRWDGSGRPVVVDGVEVRRDAHQRVTACLSPAGNWIYTYDGERLATIASPRGVRHLCHDAQGRPTQIRQDHRLTRIGWTSTGARRDAPLVPNRWHRDELGRLWTIIGPDGQVETTFLWDGFACLGRIDGPLGEPLAATWSLDPSCTPVRIITPAGVHRVPRDAFGEGLLDHPGTPGLYGGAVHEGFVHLRARSLDPLTGTFDSPDPWHGLSDDPRRSGGYQGPLLVEDASAGPYVVCQYDPIGRTDPTGEVSILLILSDLTWSLQNNLLGWFGLDATINFWGSLIGSLFQVISGSSDETLISRFFDFQGLSSSSRLGAFGVRRDGLVTYKNPPRAWTYQHQVWAIPEEIDDLKAVRVFDPKGPFRPTLYGSVIRAVPSRGAPFLLRSMSLGASAGQSTGLTGWSRSGGPAEAVIPGSLVPHFPSGGLHFDTTRTALDGPVGCVVTELEPSGSIGVGTIEERIAIVVRATGLGLNTDARVLLTDAGTGVVISRVLAATEEDGSTRILLETAAASAGVGPTQIRLRGLGAAASNEPLSAVSPNPGPGPDNLHLSVTGSAGTYATGDVLRLSQTGAQVGAAIVARLETRLQLDAALPDTALPHTLTAPLRVSIGQASGSPTKVTLIDDTIFELPANQTAPRVNDAIVVSNGGNFIAVVVKESPTPQQRKVDRSLAALGGAGAEVDIQELVRGAELGTRSEAPETDPVITYQPNAIRTAPLTGFLHVEDSSATVAVGNVGGLVYDALVIGAGLPGNTGAPYDVERMPIAPPDHSGLAFSRLINLALDPTVTLDGVGLRLHQLASPTITAGPIPGPLPTATVTGSVASVTLAVGGSATTPIPSQFVVLSQAGTVEPAVVSQVRATATFDRDLSVSANGLQIVPLAQSGPTYLAERRDVLLVTVLPRARVTTVTPPAIDVQMPRFQVGELVEANWTSAPRAHQYRITAVEGATLTLVGDADIPAGIADLTITRLVPANPNTGGSRLGIDGTPVIVAPSTTTRQVQFSVWSPNAFSGVTRVAIVDGTTVLPAGIDATAPQPVDIVFAAAPGLTGAGVEITIPVVAQVGHAASFTQQGASVTINDDPAPLTPATTPVVAIAFRETTRAATGELGPGTVLVPEDPEHAELDRRQSLVDHELRHTLQSALWGPLLLGWFPLAALEGVLELTTDIELPAFSAYVAGEIESDGSTRFLKIPDPAGITFQPGDRVQVTTGGAPAMLTLGAVSEANRFRVEAGLDVATGAVHVRRETPSSFWRDVPFNVLQTLTHGGMLNLLAGSVYGGLIFGVGKLIYAAGRAWIFGSGKNFPATMEDDGKRLRLGNEADGQAMLGASRVIIQDTDGNNTIVRSIAGVVSDGIIELATAVTEPALQNAVRVAPYAVHTPDSNWDWHDYYPARVPDPARPAAIRVEEVNGKKLTLDVFDRVTVTAGTASKRTNVTAVTADGTVELEEPPVTSGESRDFRIAKIDERDPMGNADSAAMTELGMGWMRWAFDPYSQLNYRLKPDPGSFWGMTARIARYLFGTQSWSAAIPGWFFWDNAFKQAGSSPKGHLSQMEQDASEQSGDLYSPIGRLRGNLAVVGDVARYWYFVNLRSDTVIMTGQHDAPGVHITGHPCLFPFVTAETGSGAPDPNRGAEAAPIAQAPGLSLPDVFTLKNRTDPRDVTLTTPRRFIADARGWVPVSPVLERTSGIYAAFTLPGSHRITVLNGIVGAADAREAQDTTKVLSSAKKQTLFFNVTVGDVDVTVAGQTVAQGDTVTLVQTQRANVAVTPNANRRYVVALTQPASSPILRTDGDLTLVAQTQNTTAPEPVEISRVHLFNAGTGSFESSALGQHGLHLPGDVHIPVRRINVDVVSTVPLRNALSTDPATVVTSRLPGEEAFVLVPAPIVVPLRLTSPSGALDPHPQIGVEAVTDEVKAFIGDGGIFKITFPKDDPPAEPTDLIFQIDVGNATQSATLEARTQYLPHFRLEPAAGGSNFQVARGSSLTLTCTDGVNAGTVVVVPSARVTTAVTGQTVTLTIQSNAGVGPRRVLVENAANADQIAMRVFEIT